MNLNIDDLMQKCSRCGGTGSVQRPSEPNMVYATPIECNDCNGVGKRLTETGKAIAELVRTLKNNPQLK